MKKGSDVKIVFPVGTFLAMCRFCWQTHKKRTAQNERFFLLTRTGIEPMLPP